MKFNWKIYFMLLCCLTCNIGLLQASQRGQCGPNAFWDLSDNGTLTIYGTGEMQCSNTPWVNGWSRGSWCKDGNRNKIKNLVIQYGITKIDHDAFGNLPIKSVTLPSTIKEIEDRAFCQCKQLITINLPQYIEQIGCSTFCGCENLSSIILPNSLSKIGPSAFARCAKLKSVIVPNNIKVLERRVFAECSGLVSVNITDGVETLEQDVFTGCENITYITIPKSVVGIAGAIFNGCTQLSYIYVAPENPYYYSRDGVLFHKPDSTLVLYPPGKIGPYVIPNDTKYVNANAFSDCAGLVSVTIPNSVVGIGNAAFLRCQSLTEVILPGTIEKIGLSVFMGCDNLQTIYIPEKDEKKFKQMDAIRDVMSKLVVRNDIFIGSDVDVNIPVTIGIKNDKTFVVIIANEEYQKESEVPYALNDGRVFKEYCQKTLAIPDSNIRLRENATLNNIQQDIQWLQKIACAFNGEARIIFYYSGHGVPDEKDKSAYLLPVDGDARMASTGLKIDDIYAELGKYSAESITIFLDACFSGRQRDGEILDKTGRGVAISVKKGQPQGNMVVFSASQGDETAYPYIDQQHGMFTYFLLKKLQESSGTVAYLDLSNYIIENVRQKSIVINGKSQTPSLTISPTVGQWQSWKFN